MVVAPLGNELVDIFALPPESEAVPNAVPPALKVTFPPAFVPVLVATEAVNVTTCPSLDGFLDETTVVVEEAWFTVWLVG